MHYWHFIQSDTLIKYAIDALQDVEMDYSDALAPVKIDYQGSLGGALSSSQPMPADEQRAQFRWMGEQILAFKSEIGKNVGLLMGRVDQIEGQLAQRQGMDFVSIANHLLIFRPRAILNYPPLYSVSTKYFHYHSLSISLIHFPISTTPTPTCSASTHPE